MNEYTGWHFVQPTWRHAAMVADWALEQQPILGARGAQPFAVTVVSAWWNQPRVRPMLLVDQVRAPVAYGEIWDNPDQDESELAHLFIHPRRDSAAVYRCLIGGLVDRARDDGRAHCLVRVPRGNHEVIELTRSLGFHDVDQTTVAAWNQEQPRSYHWLEHPTFRAAVAG